MAQLGMSVSSLREAVRDVEVACAAAKTQLNIPNIEVWLSLVERYVRDVEVASSNLVTSTKSLGNPRLFFRGNSVFNISIAQSSFERRSGFSGLFAVAS